MLKSHLSHLEREGLIAGWHHRQIGKSSLPRQVKRVAGQWVKEAAVPYPRLPDPRWHTLTGWLGRAAKRWGWVSPPASLVEFTRCSDDMRWARCLAVLCLDEFEEPAHQRGAFAREFYLTLRSCFQADVSIVIASPLSALTDPMAPPRPSKTPSPSSAWVRSPRRTWRIETSCVGRASRLSRRRKHEKLIEVQLTLVLIPLELLLVTDVPSDLDFVQTDGAHAVTPRPEAPAEQRPMCSSSR
jgi:hypothetical protein